MPLEIVMFAVGYELLQNRLVEQETRSEATDWETGGHGGIQGEDGQLEGRSMQVNMSSKCLVTRHQDIFWTSLSSVTFPTMYNFITG